MSSRFSVTFLVALTVVSVLAACSSGMDASSLPAMQTGNQQIGGIPPQSAAVQPGQATPSVIVPSGAPVASGEPLAARRAGAPGPSSSPSAGPSSSPAPGPSSSPGPSPSPPAPLVASPPSLEFSVAQATAKASQTLTISGSLSRSSLSGKIAGKGNCPTITKAGRTRLPGGTDDTVPTLTVSPAGAGPASCTLTVATVGGPQSGASLAVPITVDPTTAPSSSPVPSSSPSPVSSASPAPNAP
ncbi:MAG TPA: hypothetical protein VE591_01360 [Candidatus Acidoferrum sp.]|nr:hypothetical protein [Candidatus Acidoferrum sp.]